MRMLDVQFSTMLHSQESTKGKGNRTKTKKKKQDLTIHIYHYKMEDRFRWSHKKKGFVIVTKGNPKSIYTFHTRKVVYKKDRN